MEPRSAQTNLSTQTHPPKKGSRFPLPNEQPRGSERDPFPAPAGTQAADGGVTATGVLLPVVTGAPTAPRDFRFPASRRLRNNADFRAVYSNGRSWHSPLGSLRVRPAEAGAPSRVGFSVGKRVGNAVVRNRLKRRLREIVRRHQLRSGCDFVITGRAAAATAEFDLLAATVADLMRRAQLVA